MLTYAHYYDLILSVLISFFGPRLNSVLCKKQSFWGLIMHKIPVLNEARTQLPSSWSIWLLECYSIESTVEEAWDLQKSFSRKDYLLYFYRHFSFSGCFQEFLEQLPLGYPAALWWPHKMFSELTQESSLSQNKICVSQWLPHEVIHSFHPCSSLLLPMLSC